MKAITYEKYGPPDVMYLREVEKPAPRDKEVLVKICAASVNAADWHLLTADIFLVRLMGTGMFKPRNTILGADLAGRVEAVGKAVTRFKPGDEVFGDVFMAAANGSFAEYTAAAEDALAIKPANLTFEQAAAVPLAAMTALQGLRLGGVETGKKVLINGASGGVGTYAVQIARYYGAEVTAVCSTRNLEQARALGADHVIDYTREDFTRSGHEYDIIYAANGFHTLADYMRALAPRGMYVMSGGTPAQMFQAMLLGPFVAKAGGRKIKVLSAKHNLQDLTFIKELLENGKLVPVIDRSFGLAETAEALRYLGQGHARGKVVIDVAA